MAGLEEALRQFEAVEANLVRLEYLWGKIEEALPDGPIIVAPAEYNEWCIAFERIVGELPAIDGFRLECRLYDFDEAVRMHIDAMEIGEFDVKIGVSKALGEQGELLDEYRIRFRAKRRELVRGKLVECIGRLESALATDDGSESEGRHHLARAAIGIGDVRGVVDEIDTLLGSEPRPEYWNDVREAVKGEHTLECLESLRQVWPSVKSELTDRLYGTYDPIPIDAVDLGDIVDERPSGDVTIQLNWAALGDEDFERLVFELIGQAEGYENVQWLQKTHAPDRGRDLSADRLDSDALTGVRRYRTIVQCKHWVESSIGPSDVGRARDAMALWEPPRVHALVMATSGRFTADAVAMVERHNLEDRALKIEMWPGSHLERLLAGRPHLIGQFGMRRE